MAKEYANKDFKRAGGSFIMAGRTKKNADKSAKKKEALHNEQSKIIKKALRAIGLATITEEPSNKHIEHGGKLPPLEKKAAPTLSPIYNEYKSKPDV